MTGDPLQKDRAMQKKTTRTPEADDLRRRAEARMPKRLQAEPARGGGRKSDADTQRLLHDLQVHQIELEMQNAELLVCRDRTDLLLEKYTDLYDFAPVGFFSLDQQGRILEVNLTGSALLGVERSRLITRSLPRFVALPFRPAFLGFLAKTFAGAGKQVCEARLLKDDGKPFWASLHGDCPLSLGGLRKECRVAVSDITALKQAQEAQRLMEALAVSNEELKQEIVRRQASEESLTNSELRQRQLVEQSRHLQVQLRSLSHRVLQVQEEERKRISRELHDEITQTLVGINVHLEALGRNAAVDPKRLWRKIVLTQRLVEKSVNIVHQFARDLRPTSLDDLGVIITLQSYMDDFIKRTGIRVQFTTFAGVEHLSSDRRTVLYRIVQEALTNVAKHSQASLLKVSISKVADTVHLKISDNGKAFDVDRVLHAKNCKRLGLIGMRERAEMMGGTFTVESTPGKGTTITAQIPFMNGDKE